MNYEDFIVMYLSIIRFQPFAQTPLEFYVASDGDDSNQGTYLSPFATVDRAFQEIPSDPNNHYGVNIFVLPGNYTQHIYVNKNGRENYPISILAYNSENKPVFYGDDVSVFSGKKAVFRWPDKYDYIILDRLILSDVTANVDMRGIWTNGDHNIIRNCELYTILRSGILLVGSYNRVEHNIVDNIIGTIDGVYRGNNISIESYYENNISRISEYNLIQYNVFTNNITHAGVNIFPNTLDPDQQYMHGNKVYFNYIDNTGSGIYTRYQLGTEIVGNVIVNTVDDYNTWGTNGGGITFDVSNNYPLSHPVPYNSGNTLIYNNTIADNSHYGLKNYTANNIQVVDNIFYNKC